MKTTLKKKTRMIRSLTAMPLLPRKLKDLNLSGRSYSLFSDGDANQGGNSGELFEFLFDP